MRRAHGDERFHRDGGGRRPSGRARVRGPGSFREELEGLRQAGLLRRMRRVEHLGPNVARVDGRPAILFASNDYLGLSRHPRVVEAAAQAVALHGASATASRLVNGTHALYAELEEALAAFKGAQAALVFATGYMANLGVVTALASSREDLVLLDRLDHASLYDACAMSPAKTTRYPHCDLPALERRLAEGPGAGRTLVVTDGVFSMDGDVAPLAELREATRAASAWLVVDDAHGTGVLGPRGRGSCAAAGLHPDVEIGTLSKALGSLGGFVVGDRALVDYLVNRARPLIFSTGLPPSAVAAALAALRAAEAEPWRRERVLALAARARAALSAAGYEVLPGQTPIVPIVVGDERLASALSEACLERGVFVPAIRTPSVPAGRARLRMTLCADHTDGQLEQALAVLCEARERLSP